MFDSGKPAISDFFVGQLNHEPLITIGVPVGRGDSIAFQVSATLLSSRLSELLVHQKLPPDWIVAVYDRTGTIVARSHEMSRFVGAKGASAVLKRLEQVDEGAINAVSLEGIPVLSAFSRSPSSKWAVAIGIPRSSFINRLLTWLGWLSFGLVLLLTISVTFAWRISGTITAAVHALTAPALALGSGEPVEVTALGLTEADEVGQALNKAARILASAQHVAHHGALTGLANRSLFNQIVMQQMAVAKRSGGSLAALYIDLDGFKAINDTQGHEVGDWLLQAVAARLEMNIRACDVAARLGGDEFGVALVQADHHGAAVVAAKLVESLAQDFRIGGVNLLVSASIGVAVREKGEGSYEDMLRSADEAMYRARASSPPNIDTWEPTHLVIA